MNINKVFSDFCAEYALRKGLMTEDNVRFYWFSKMLQQDPVLDNYTLEEPYPSLKGMKNEDESEEPYPSLTGKELDLKYDDSNEVMCFEIKFHRKIRVNAFPKPVSAGKFFNDIRRIALWKSTSSKPVKRYILYVTDTEMHNYITSSRSPYPVYAAAIKDFYTMPVGAAKMLTFNKKDCPKSFFDNACTSLPATGSFSVHLCHLACKHLSCPGITNVHLNGGTHDCYVHLYEVL